MTRSVALLFPGGRAGRAALTAWAGEQERLDSTDPRLPGALAGLDPGTSLVPVAPARAPGCPWTRRTEVTAGEPATVGDLRSRFEAVAGSGNDAEFAGLRRHPLGHGEHVVPRGRAPEVPPGEVPPG